MSNKLLIDKFNNIIYKKYINNKSIQKIIHMELLEMYLDKNNPHMININICSNYKLKLKCKNKKRKIKNLCLINNTNLIWINSM